MSSCAARAPAANSTPDNAAMIGCQAYYEYLRGARAGSELNAWANMEISEVPFYGRA